MASRLPPLASRLPLPAPRLPHHLSLPLPPQSSPSTPSPFPSLLAPLSLTTLSLRLAAGGGTIDDHPAAALVAAGYTLLQRCPPLVLALDRRRAGILLPPSPQWLVALAAAEGRGAVLLDPNLSRPTLASELVREDVGVVMTFASLAARLPAGTPVLLLDDAPRRARFVPPDASPREIDLGSHFGLSIEGAVDVDGRDEECLVTVVDPDRAGTDRASVTHRALLAASTDAARTFEYTAESTVRASWDWSRTPSLVRTLLAPLLAGASVVTPAAPRP